MIATEIKAVAAAVFAAFGIAAPPHVVLGGLFFAITGAFLTATVTPERSTREIAFAVGCAVVFALGVAVVGNGVLDDWPLQIKMGLAGAFARYFVMLIPRVGDRIVDRSEDVADSVIDRVAGNKEPK